MHSLLSAVRPLARFSRVAAASVCLAAAAATVSPAAAATDNRTAVIVVDAGSGKVLYAVNPDARRYPASLTKMMTLYVLFEEMDRGRISNSTRFEVSAHAAAQAPSKLGLRPGQTITALEAIRALVTKSANDAAVAIAEGVSGSEPAFAARMTDTARRIGMRNTVFRNANGLPNPAQFTTARDLATLGLALQKRFPTQYRHFSTASFSFRGRVYANHNRLLGRVQGVDGIKTGYIRASGFNLVTSAQRNGRRIVAVVMGGNTGRERDQKMAGLVERFLPQATQSSGALVAYAAPPAEEIVQPQAVPVPGAAPRAAAIAADDGEDGAPVEASGAPLTLASYEPAAPAAYAPAPQTLDSAAAQLEASGEGDAEAADTPDDVRETAAIPRTNRDGWKIQIGAMPDRDAAEAYLGTAKSRFGSLLGRRQPYTEPVRKGQVTLYRARFAGFDTQASAQAACAQLVKRDYACLAIRQ